MATKLSPELRQELAEHPHQAVPLVDEQTGKTYYICDEEFLFGDLGEASRGELRRQLEEAIASGKPVEKDKAHARMNVVIDRFRPNGQ